MRRAHLKAAPLLFLLLTGCSSRMLEDVGEVAVLPPQSCSESTKLFNTFSMRATRTAWTDSTLTVDLVINNEKSFPIALSNSGNGVLYAIEISLQDGKGKTIGTKETSGVALAPEAKTLQAAPSRSVFGEKPTKLKSASKLGDTNRSLNFRIGPGQPEPAQLVFQAPRDNYLLTIARKFAGKPDMVAVCKISAG